MSGRLRARFIVFTAALAVAGAVVPSRAQETEEKAIGGAEQFLSATGVEPAIATYGRGGFVIVWTDSEAGDPTNGGIRGALLPPGALAPRPQFSVNTTTAGFQNHPAVAADSAGRFVVVWQSADAPAPTPGPGNPTVFGQRYGVGGARQGGEIPLSSPGTEAQFTPKVAMGDNGAFVASWVSLGNGIESITAARFSANGSPVGSEIDLPAMGDAGNDGAQVVHYPGGFAVGWNELTVCPFGLGPDNAAVDRFDNSGRPVGRVYRLIGDVCAERGFGLAGLAASRAGALAVFSGPDGYSAQRFAPSGQPVGGLFPLSDGPFCEGLQCRVVGAMAMDDNGRFALVWETIVNLGGSNLTAQLYSAANKPRGGPVPVNLTPSAGPEFPAAALANDGSLEVAWTRVDSAHADRNGLFVRRLRMP
ncbi:MAG TPA: hypothetical protein VH988_12110 [Thermoanaerobaculia bacterium]|nr:hypothetical protein [Thermoanaerobaculia bacterium]